MMQLMIGAVCALLFLLTLAVRRVYYCVPTKELKRLARQRDQVGASLYGVVAFDGSLAALLWFSAGVFAAASFVLFALALSPALAGAAIALTVWLGFGWIAPAFPHGFMIRFTTFISPGVAWILSNTHGILGRISRSVRRYHRVLDHTGLYEKQDVTELLARQREQLDSRVPHADIELMERVLAFGDKVVSDVAVPRKQVRLVRLTETIGPKLMDELHKSGQHLFLVCDETKKHIVGLVRLEDLVKARHGGAIQSVADESVYFVRDDFFLSHALEVFRQTKQRLLVVINNFEEFVGVLTLDGLLEQIMGEQTADAAENIYGDRKAVATYQPPEPAEILPEPSEAGPTDELAIVAEQPEVRRKIAENQENAPSDAPEVVE